jgi:hypothetical protein
MRTDASGRRGSVTRVRRNGSRDKNEDGYCGDQYELHGRIGLGDRPGIPTQHGVRWIVASEFYYVSGSLRPNLWIRCEHIERPDHASQPCEISRKRYFKRRGPSVGYRAGQVCFGIRPTVACERAKNLEGLLWICEMFRILGGAKGSEIRATFGMSSGFNLERSGPLSRKPPVQISNVWPSLSI